MDDMGQRGKQERGWSDTSTFKTTLTGTGHVGNDVLNVVNDAVFEVRRVG